MHRFVFIYTPTFVVLDNWQQHTQCKSTFVWSVVVLFCLFYLPVVHPPVYLSRCEPAGEVRALYEAPPRLWAHGLSGRVYTLYVLYACVWWRNHIAACERCRLEMSHCWSQMVLLLRVLLHSVGHSCKNCFISQLCILISYYVRIVLGCSLWFLGGFKNSSESSMRATSRAPCTAVSCMRVWYTQVGEGCKRWQQCEINHQKSQIDIDHGKIRTCRILCCYSW